MKKIKLKRNYIRSANRAFLDNIPCSLRGIRISSEKTEVVLNCIFDGEIIEDDKASLEDAAGQIWADYPEVSNVRVNYIRKDMPESILHLESGYWLYRRKEKKYLD